jgi:hypothetical protein
MGAKPRVRMIVLALAALTMLQAGSASAQFFDEAQRAYGLTPDPLARSPRLVGMGLLGLVVPDRDNEIDLWDFAGNPVGVVDADSTSVFEVRPTTWAGSGVHDVFTTDGEGRERQDMALRSLGISYEAWQRTHGGTTYGLLGAFQTLRHDQPFTSDTELRTQFSQPSVTPVLSGAVPFLAPDRLLYALFTRYAYMSSTDFYRDITRNAVGDYIDQNGGELEPPNFFDPDEYSITSEGGGAALSYDLGAPLKAALSFDYTSNDVHGKNEGTRYSAETIETRPYRRGQASLVGHFGNLTYGADAQGWKAASEQRWVFTISAGAGATPLTGRGKLLERREEGSTLRTRAHWTLGDLVVGAGYQTFYRQVEIIGPSPFDESSLNRFLDDIYYRIGADTLALPDSVTSGTRDEHAWDAGGGLSWRVRGGRTIVGIEGHYNRDLFTDDVAGMGPKRLGWDVRGGAEVPVAGDLVLRGGYIHRWEDRDDFTDRNEYISNAATFGLGLHPRGSLWSLDTGYVFEWTQADFGDPGSPRESRQRLSLLVRWAF